MKRDVTVQFIMSAVLNNTKFLWRGGRRSYNFVEVSASSPIPRVFGVEFFVKSTLISTQNLKV